ncbi:hypothetical protein E2C01_049391 [Portunus trituberculatus]|uniref:Uncharacterized protein n=1 Tax=Portunus trituberculatus TaxID=210409 RepID=A0A5B7GD12_PORTR|nr:hypothetical protein [Portunus trituberculatus]
MEHCGGHMVMAKKSAMGFAGVGGVTTPHTPRLIAVAQPWITLDSRLKEPSKPTDASWTQMQGSPAVLPSHQASEAVDHTPLFLIAAYRFLQSHTTFSHFPFNTQIFMKGRGALPWSRLQNVKGELKAPLPKRVLQGRITYTLPFASDAVCVSSCGKG